MTTTTMYRRMHSYVINAETLINFKLLKPPGHQSSIMPHLIHCAMAIRFNVGMILIIDSRVSHMVAITHLLHVRWYNIIQDVIIWIAVLLLIRRRVVEFRHVFFKNSLIFKSFVCGKRKIELFFSSLKPGK